MATRGRKPKPTALKLLEGNPGKRQLNMTYPATVSTLFLKMCQYVGVSYESDTFINSSATISEEPEEFSNVTMREVLGWIAELAASNPFLSLR